MCWRALPSCRQPLTGQPRRGCLTLESERVQSAGTHWLSVGNQTSLTARFKLFFWVFSIFLLVLFPAFHGFSVCCGRSALLGFFFSGDLFPGRFSVTSEADLSIRLSGGTDPRTGKGLIRYPLQLRNLTMVSQLRSRASTAFIHAVLGLRLTLPEASRRRFFAVVEAAARPFPWVYDLRLTGGVVALALILLAQVIIARMVACSC